MMLPILSEANEIIPSGELMTNTNFHVILDAVLSVLVLPG
jgi:hypothetical protein